jgi:hypothetical protein
MHPHRESPGLLAARAFERRSRQYDVVARSQTAADGILRFLQQLVVLQSLSLADLLSLAQQSEQNSKIH